jgi:hypothetical protein
VIEKHQIEGVRTPGRLSIMKTQIEKERIEFKELLLQNPNYFGTLPAAGVAPQQPMQGNTKYEELRCLGFHPERDQLEAIIEVKLPSGYSGSLCSTGSHEYVRFYVDWDGDGDFTDTGEDAGVASLNVHDIPDDKGRCRDRAKPLSYAVRIVLHPRKSVCRNPDLIRVRAILSWNVPPPPETPDYPPVWGNVLEEWIQIQPREYLLGDLLEVVDLSKAKLDPTLLDATVPISKGRALTLGELEKVYRGKDVPRHRYNLPAFAPIVAQIKQQPQMLAQYAQDPAYASVVEIVQAMLADKPQTKYEELHCVGLLYNHDALAATLTVKLPYGYDGGLCTDGSDEHVAFWARVYDQIEQQCAWRYLGTASVNVHDIEGITEDGLQYAVSLPYDFSSWKKACSTPVVIQIRAVLSWRELPSTTNPYENPTWGNAVESLIQLKPDDPTIPGAQKPYIWSVGEMAVESISGNVYTTVGSALGSGYANGPNINGGFAAVESPFGSVAQVSGTITGAPDNPAEADKLRYKVQYKKSAPGTTWHDIDNAFRIWIRIDGGPLGHLDQVASGGYYKFQKDLDEPGRVEVQDDVLALWNTRKAEGDGLYLLRVLLYQPGAPAMPGVPPDHVSSRTIKVMVDNTSPVAEISLDAGPCTKFTIGDKFTGKFTATDVHIWRYSVVVLPTTPVTPTVSPAGGTYPLLASPGAVDETFEVTTTSSTSPCGYAIRLAVRDRTIVDNHFPGHWAMDSVGLCLLEEDTE